VNKWRKSSYSGHNGACVEVRLTDSIVGVRDSKNTDAAHLTLTAAGWRAFVGLVVVGEGR
jgi:hypothetical protein